MKIVFTHSALKGFKKLHKTAQIRINEKLHFYALQENPLRSTESLKDKRFGEYRFRIGEYRVLCDIENDKIIVLKVGHRKNIYK